MLKAVSSALSIFVCGMTAIAVVNRFPGIGIFFNSSLIFLLNPECEFPDLLVVSSSESFFALFPDQFDQWN